MVKDTGTSRRINVAAVVQWLCIVPAVGIVVFLLVVPLINLATYSFQGISRDDFGDGSFTFSNYQQLLTDSFLRGIIFRTFLISFLTTLLALLLALPLGYFLSRTSSKVKSTLTVLVLFPLLAGNVVLSIGWVGILGSSGILAQLLTRMGLISGPLDIMQTTPTLVVLMALIDLPVIVLSLQSSFDQINVATEKAALCLGAPRIVVFFSILLPQLIPGILAGVSLAFVLTVNAYATPTLIGGQKVLMAAPKIYSLIATDGYWPQGSAFALIVICLSLVITGLFSFFGSKAYMKWEK